MASALVVEVDRIVGLDVGSKGFGNLLRALPKLVLYIRRPFCTCIDAQLVEQRAN